MRTKSLKYKQITIFVDLFKHFNKHEANQQMAHFL